jgi:hypothetical protein
MALSSQVTTRYSEQFLRSLTNPDASEASSNDSARLALACTDTEAQFEILTGAEYDDTDARHVSVGVEGVILALRERGGTSGIGDAVVSARARWEERCRALGRVTARNRMLPRTSSELTPSEEVTGTSEVRPDFDRENFGDYVLAPPFGPTREPTS